MALRELWALRALSLTACVILVIACSDSTEPGPLDGTFTLASENDQPLPSDPSAPNGCCLTLSGRLTLSGGSYDLSTTHRNKNTSVTFDNSEQGTFVLQGNTLTFTRTGGGGEGVPYLLAPGTVSSDRQTITLLYGDEGPGSNQIRGTYVRIVTPTYGPEQVPRVPGVPRVP